MPDDGSLAELRLIWSNAGRPEQAKFRDAAKRAGRRSEFNSEGGQQIHTGPIRGSSVRATAEERWEGHVSSIERAVAVRLDGLQKQNPGEERRQPPGPHLRGHI